MPVNRKIDLMIFGAEKSGTSSLSRYLGEHPQVGMHSQREMNYFLIEEEFTMSFNSVLSQYYDATALGRERIAAKCVGLMDYAVGIRRLREHNPDMHLVAVLRNPVSRAYSAYWYARRRAWETAATFEEAIDRELNDTAPADIRTKADHFRRAYLRRGRYCELLENVLQEFPKEQVHIYLMEDLKSQPQGILADVCAKLSVDSSFESKSYKVHNKAAMPKSVFLAKALGSRQLAKTVGYFLPKYLRKNIKARLERANEREFSVPLINPETLEMLMSYYKFHNDKLSLMFGLDLSAWRIK